MKICEQLPWTALLLFFILSTPLSSQKNTSLENPALDKYFEYLPSDQKRNDLNLFVGTIEGLGFQLRNYKNTEKTQSSFQLTTAYSYDYSSYKIGINRLPFVMGLSHITELEYGGKNYIKDNLFAGLQAGISFANNGRNIAALLELQAKVGFGRIYRVEEKASADRIISELRRSAFLAAEPSEEQLRHFASTIGTLMNDRKFVNRGKVKSELETIISFLQAQGLISPSVDLDLVSKMISNNYKYEFLSPRESGKTISLLTLQEYYLANNLYDQKLWDKRTGVGISFDNKKYISEKIQWNTFSNVDFYLNSIQLLEPRSMINYYSAHASVSTKMDYYFSSRSQFGAQLTLAYDHYEKLSGEFVPYYFNFELEDKLSARLDLEYEFQFSRKNNITLSSYFEYSRKNGLLYGLGVKFRL